MNNSPKPLYFEVVPHMSAPEMLVIIPHTKKWWNVSPKIVILFFRITILLLLLLTIGGLKHQGTRFMS